MAFSLKVGDASVINLNRFWYDQTLNGIRNFEIVTDSNDSTLRSEYSTGKVVEIYRNGALELKGKVKEANNFQSGGIILIGLGQEKELTEEKCPVDSGKNTKTWTSTSSNTIFNTLVTTVAGWSVDTSGATSVTLDSFRVSKSMSIWNGVIQLLKHINKDIYINDSTKTLYLVNSKNRTGKAIFNEGINCGQVNWSESVPKAAKVEVYGKGDGKNQITGSAGSGTPVHEVIDRNVITTTEANTRAQKELDLIENSVKHYFFDANNPNEDVELGDTVKLNASSAGLHDVGIDVVRFTRGLSGDSETLTLEVTNPQYRTATKNLHQDIAKSESESITSRSAMQGSGNTQSWARGINAKSGAPLIVPFYVSSDFVEDEAGNLRIDSLTLDYDVDPYRRGVGSASENNKEPALDGSTAAASHGHNPYETGSGHEHQNPATTSAVSLSFQGDTGKAAEQGSASNLASGSWTVIGDFSSSYITSCEGHHVHIDFENDNASSMYWNVRVELGAGYYYPNSTGIRVRAAANAWASLDFVVPVQAFTGSPLANYDIEVKPDAANSDLWHYHWWIESHKHNISSYNSNDNKGTLDDSNRSPSVSGKTVLHAHDVSVGDDVSDAGSVNASEVDIYLDFWNTGTSNWDNKHSVLNTGKTMDTDLDITNGGTYPDAVGFWRVRIDPDHASPDLVQGIIKLKHQLDN